MQNTGVVLALALGLLAGGPARAETGVEQQAAWQAAWRSGIAQAEARRRAVQEGGAPQERRSQDPSVVGFVKAWWAQGRLALAEGRSQGSDWALLGDAQGRLLALVEAKRLPGLAFDERRLLRGGGSWWLRRVRREAGSASQFEELRPARVAEVQAAERRWSSLQSQLGKP